MIMAVMLAGISAVCDRECCEIQPFRLIKWVLWAAFPPEEKQMWFSLILAVRVGPADERGAVVCFSADPEVIKDAGDLRRRRNLFQTKD